jgi:peptidoglycan/LPS O-acetylase OafA/YrhL
MTTDRLSSEASRFDAAPRETRYIPTLDGWRAVAITIVMLQHSSDQLESAFGSWTSPVTDVFHDHGRFGVFIFFAISGFLITSLLVDERLRVGRVDLKAFYIRRAFRILPPLLLVLAVFGLLGAADVIPVPSGKWLGSLFFVQNYTPGGSWYLGHFWSLSIEEQFYLFWPLALSVLGPRRGLKVCMTLIGAVCVWRYVDLAAGISKDWPTGFIDRTDTQVDGLMWGCLMALLWVRPGFRERIASLTAGWRWWLVLAALVVSQAATITQPFGQSVQLAIRPALVALVVVGTVAQPQRATSRALEIRPLRYVGRISYSLYLWQQLFLVWDDFASPRLQALQRFPISVGCAFLCAVLSHRFVEKPTIRLGRRFAARVRVGDDARTPGDPPQGVIAVSG